MDFIQGPSKPKKNSPLVLSVLCIPPRYQLRQIPSPSSQFLLYQYTPKKVTLAAHTTFIPKYKLLSNLEIYQWRCQTEFPIVKTIFVNVKLNETHSSQIVELQTYNEYCPLKLTQIYQMHIGQSLYLLKEAMIGFQRLYNRFGGFDILNSMIMINEKGFCRVWLNQNSALNSIPKKQISQSKMVTKIITIIQTHSQQSRATKKLFTSLKTCQSFLSVLKAIDQFIKESKIIVPTRFATLSSSKQISRIEGPFSCKHIQSPVMTRFSIKQEKIPKLNESIRDQVKNNLKDRNRSYSPIQIKRLKSEESITGAEAMKISDGQTAYTGKANRTSNIQAIQNSTKQAFCPKGPLIINKQARNLSYSYKKRAEWMEQSSYVMGEEENQSKTKESPKNKNQLSHSVAFKADQQVVLQDSERKYSCKLYKQRKQTSNSKNPYFSKKNINEPYFAQFTNLLERDDKEYQVSSPKIQEVDEERFLENHSRIILKNNGWVPNVSGLMDIPKNLQQSFHEGQDENLVKKEINLERLNKLGKQQMHTSILPEQINELR